MLVVMLSVASLSLSLSFCVYICFCPVHALTFDNLNLETLFYSALVGERSTAISLSVCLSVCMYVREHISGTAGPIFTKFLCRFPVAVARSTSGGVAILYVLLVLWMTSPLVLVGRMAMRGRLNL